NATQTESDALTKQAESLEESPAGSAPGDESAAKHGEGDAASDHEIEAYLAEHAKELGEEGEKPFQPLGGFYRLALAQSEKEEAGEVRSEEVVATAVTTPAATANTPAETASAPAKTISASAAKPAMKKVKAAGSEERGSSLQKINKLDVKGRIQLAMKGNKE